MHQGALLGHNWSAASRRTANSKNTVGTSIRGPPASRAQWNVQVVRGKVTSRCLWNACKALSLGLLLMLIGGAMATIGYFADQLSVNQEVRGNSTVHVKNESRGFHLNNLSYAGPIVMGVGGFIVVAACVMTFEARDSAAKVVPARFKPKSSPPRSRGDDGSGRRSAGCQTRWDNLGVFRAVAQGATTLGLATPLASALPSPAVSVNRREMKAAFVHFSRTIQSSVDSAGNRRGSLAKCPSAPNLAAAVSASTESSSPSGLMSQFIRSPPPQSATASAANRGKLGRRQSSSLRQACPLLSPHPLQQRQALSVDYTNFPLHYSPLMHVTPQLPKLPQPVERAGFEMSMAMDLHLPDDCQVTLRVRDQNSRAPSFSSQAPKLHQRSETARRHQLTRQKPVVDDSTLVEVSSEVPARVRRAHQHSRRDSSCSSSGGKARTHRHRVRRSNTTCSSTKPPSLGEHELRMRRSFEDQTALSLTPSPERNNVVTLQVHSNPQSSTHSFELTSSVDVEPQPSCSHHPDPH